MTHLFRSELEALQVYRTHAYPPNALRLDANELSVDLPHTIKADISQELCRIDWNRYPDGNATELRAVIAHYQGVAEDQILLGVGSDEVLAILMHATSRKFHVITPTPTFVMAKVNAQAHGHPVIEVPLLVREGIPWQLDMHAMAAAIQGTASAIVYLASPNNPTGNAWPDADLESLMRSFPQALFIIDEAYGPFAARSLVSWTARFENLLVLGTMSKVGFAALRVGWMIGSSEKVSAFEKVRQPYNLNMLSQVAVSRVLSQHRDWIQEVIAETSQRRDALVQALRELSASHPTLEVFPTDANFLLIRIPNAVDVHAKLKASNIFTRIFTTPELTHCLRITVGSTSENTQLLSRLEHAIT